MAARKPLTPEQKAARAEARAEKKALQKKALAELARIARFPSLVEVAPEEVRATALLAIQAFGTPKKEMAGQEAMVSDGSP